MSARWRCGLLCRPAGQHADAGGFEDPWLVQGELGDQGMVRCRPEFGGGQQRNRARAPGSSSRLSLVLSTQREGCQGFCYPGRNCTR